MCLTPRTFCSPTHPVVWDTSDFRRARHARPMDLADGALAMTRQALYRRLSMSDIHERYRRVTGDFTNRVQAVPLGAWDNPSPCEGWTARDVVRHLTGWIPGFFGAHGIEFPPVPSVQDDPVASWETVQATLAQALADPVLAERTVETPFSTQSLAATVDMIVIGDVFTHTWDLARATGQDETLDPEQLQRMIAGIGSMPEEALRADGMFGPPIEVSADADDQTRLLAYFGRRA